GSRSAAPRAWPAKGGDGGRVPSEAVRPVRLVLETATFAIGAVAVAVMHLYAGAVLLRDVPEQAQQSVWLAAATCALLLASVMLAARWAVILWLAMRGHVDRTLRPAPEPVLWPRVSVLVPAYNEQETIERALRSLLALDYPDLEIVCVDDGSSDRTLELARRVAAGSGPVSLRVLHQANGGKWSALNLAWRNASGELFLFVDADSHLEPDAVRWLVRTMACSGADAVAGQVRVRNRHRLLTLLQALEYLACQSAVRAAQHVTGTVLVVPGPIGLYRREALAAVRDRFGCIAPDARTVAADGPVHGDTFAEDFDLSLSVLALGGRVVYEPRAVAHTKGPATALKLLNQRYRWLRGSLQVLRKFVRRTASDAGLSRPTLVVWLLATYGVDFVLTPALVGLGTAAWLCNGLPNGFGETAGLLLLAWIGTGMVTTVGFASTHRDRLGLALLEPVAVVYMSLFLRAMLPFVVLDELRRMRMRW
ncbi:MAG TPA: glycosyltransferase family 2 protein, partial [Planctomycetota bacterium]|nr:glycosyltransferase family 2 protein [Planctomycetota bacterium]